MTTLAVLKSNENPITVRLPRALHQKLSQLAKVTGRTKSFYMVRALEEVLDLD